MGSDSAVDAINTQVHRIRDNLSENDRSAHSLLRDIELRESVYVQRLDMALVS